MSTTSNAQDWVDRELYPFKSNTIALEAGKMHYVDEGKGKTILFVHGTPTWSFLYRDFIKELSSDYRCIAIDHLGFGLSEKSTSFSGTPQEHAKNLNEFINKLNLKDITLVLHDFGGPIGLSSAIDNENRIAKIVLFNTWLWATKDDPAAQEIDKIVTSEMGKDYYLNMNYSPKVLLKEAFYDKSKLSDKEHQQYIAPFPDPNSRIALLNIGKAFVGSSDWYDQKWKQLDNKLGTKKWLILWGSQDKFLSDSYLDKWKQKLTNARIKEFNCGHFVQEEYTNEAIDEIRNFME